jgi:hypothetical protein
MINIIFKNSIVIRMFAIEHLNTILLLGGLKIKSLIKETDGVPWQFSVLFSVCRELKTVDKFWLI